MTDNRRLGWSLAALGMLLVSTDSLFIRLAETNAWNVAFLVATFSLPVYLVFNRWLEPSGPVAAFGAFPGPLLAVAVLAGLSQITFISAITRTDVANVVVIVAAAPILAAVAARLFIGEHTGGRVWTAIGITIIGIVIVVSGSIGEPNLDGDLLALVAIAAFAANMVIWRRYTEMSRFVGLAVSAVLVIVVTAFFASPFALDRRAYLAVAAMGFVFNPLGRVAHTNAPRFAPASEVALFTPVETVAATLWAWLAFREAPTAATVIGGTIVLVGVLYGTFGIGRGTPRRPRP